MTDLVYFK